MHSIRWLTPDHRWRLAAGMSLWLISAAQAAVTLDGSLGRGGALPGPNYQITADWGQQRGGNLFHSFGVFSINTGESATFSGPGSVSNIIGRVTGGQVSFIDGAIRSTIPGANLYLLNPAGVLFGEHAALDVPGSVHISTADYLRLSDGGRFDARTPGNSVLTVAPVAAFGFLSETPGKIEVNGGFLRVPEGQTLSLIGGDITLTNATLYAPAGRINLASVGSAGEVIPSDTDLAMQGFGTLGTLTLTHTGDPRQWNNLVIGDVDTSGEGGGAIFIRGGQWSSQGGKVFADTYGNQDGRGVNVSVQSDFTLENGARITSDTYGGGNAESITLDANRLILLGGSQISSHTWGVGNGGDLHITAREAVLIADTDTAHDVFPNETFSGLTTEAEPSSSGNAGNINVFTGRLNLSGGGQISSGTWGAGHGGDLTILASESVIINGTTPNGHFGGMFANSEPGATGNAGAIRINAPLISLENNGRVETNADVGNAGTIIMEADRLNLTGGGQIGSDIGGTGRGGNINITAREVMIAGAGEVNMRRRNGTIRKGYFHSGIFALAEPDEDGAVTGDAGTINLTTNRLTLTGSGQIATSTGGTGQGGDINIVARESIVIAGVDARGISSSLESSAYATGNAGAITVTTPYLTLADGGTITASSEISSGGKIVLNADHLRLFNGGLISTSVYGDFNTSGGNIILNSSNIVVLNGSSITAKATQGKGGNILVNADVFLHDAAHITDVLNASSQVEGNDGTVQNNAPTTDISGNLTVLPANYLDAAGQLSRRCGTGNPESRSRFTVQGRGGLPAAPDAPIPTRVTGCRSESPTLVSAAPHASTLATQSENLAAGFGNQ